MSRIIEFPRQHEQNPSTPQAVMLVGVRTNHGLYEMLVGDRPDGLGGTEIVPPGGNLKPGEPPVKGLIREVQEETEMDLTGVTLQSLGVRNLYAQNRQVISTEIFTANFGHHQTPSFNPSGGTELFNVRWLPLAQAPILFAHAKQGASPEKLERLNAAEATFSMIETHVKGIDRSKPFAA